MKNKMSRDAAISFLICLLCLLCLASSMPSRLSSLNAERSVLLASGWSYTTKSQPIPTPVILPADNIHNTTSGTITLTRVLPSELLMGATLMLRTTQQAISVLVNGKQIYSFGSMKSQNILGNTVGDAIHLVRLPNDYPSKTLTVEIYSFDKEVKSIANTIYFGTKSSHIFSVLKGRLVNTITGILLFAFGAAVLIFYLITRKMSSKTRGLFYLAGFAVLSGTWVIIEGGLLQFVINSPLLLYSASVLALFTFPLMLMQFLGSDYVFKKSHEITIAIYIHRLFVLASLLLQLFWQVDFHSIMPVYYAIIVAETALVFYLCYKNRRRSVATVIAVAVGGLVISIIIGMLIISQNRASDTVEVIHYGILFFTAVVSISAGRQIILMTKTTALNSALEQLAYADPMTGLKNRAAFQARMDSYEHEPELLDKVTIAVADLNFLKKINDTFGHKKGDEIIVLCAATLANCFGELGTVYRIGGDEFAIIMDNVTTPQCNEALNAVTAAMKQSNKSDEAQIFSVAVGLVHYNWAYDKSINDLFTRADTAMYNKKESLKKAQNTRWNKACK